MTSDDSTLAYRLQNWQFRELWNEYGEQFDEMLDECYESFKMGELEYWPSQILKECDPITHRECFWDYLDSLEDDSKEKNS